MPLDLETESHLVWGDLIRAIVNKEWKKANVAKKRLEVAQRRLMKEIKEGRKKWEPRLFRLGEHPDRGPLAGLYTTKSNVRTDPPAPTRCGTNSSRKRCSRTCEAPETSLACI